MNLSRALFAACAVTLAAQAAYAESLIGQQVHTAAIEDMGVAVEDDIVHACVRYPGLLKCFNVLEVSAADLQNAGCAQPQLTEAMVKGVTSLRSTQQYRNVTFPEFITYVKDTLASRDVTEVIDFNVSYFWCADYTTLSSPEGGHDSVGTFCLYPAHAGANAPRTCVVGAVNTLLAPMKAD